VSFNAQIRSDPGEQQHEQAAADQSPLSSGHLRSRQKSKFTDCNASLFPVQTFGSMANARIERGKQCVTLCRRVQAVPSDDYGARPLIRIEPQQEIAKPRMAPAPLPSLRRMVFGNAWYDRWAKESPSMTSSWRPESAGWPILAGFAVPSHHRSDGSIAPFSAKPSLPR
jgi:hypothetical protein